MPAGMPPTPTPPMPGAAPPPRPPGSTAPATISPQNKGMEQRAIVLVGALAKGLSAALHMVGPMSKQGQAINKALAALAPEFGVSSGDLTRQELKLLQAKTSGVGAPDQMNVNAMKEQMKKKLMSQGVGGGAPSAPPPAPGPSPSPEPALAGAM